MLSLAKDNQAPRLGRHSVFIIRALLACVWIYWGTRFGIIHQVWSSAGPGVGLADSLGLTGPGFSFLVGGLLIGMGVWLISGLAHHVCALVQVVLLFFVWWLNHVDGLTFLDRLVQQLPMILLIFMLWLYGPGTFVWSKRNGRASTWTRG